MSSKNQEFSKIILKYDFFKRFFIAKGSPHFRTWGTLTQSSAVRVGARSTLPQLITKNRRSHKASSSRNCYLHVRDLLNHMKGVISPALKTSPKQKQCSDMFGPSQSRMQNPETLFHPAKQLQANRRLRSYITLKHFNNSE